MENESRLRKIKRIRDSILISIGVFVLFKIVVAFKDTSKALEDNLPSSYTITSEDSSLFAPSYRKDMKVVEVKRSKRREDFIILFIDKKYVVTIEQLKVPQDISLVNAVHIEQGRTIQTTGIVYSIWPFRNYTYKQKADSSESKSNIYLSLSGTSIQRQRVADSVVSFYLQAKTISLRYIPKGPTDIYITGDETFMFIKPVAMNLMVLKKNGAVYFIVLAEKDGKELPKRNVIDEIFS